MSRTIHTEPTEQPEDESRGNVPSTWHLLSESYDEPETDWADYVYGLHLPVEPPAGWERTALVHGALVRVLERRGYEAFAELADGCTLEGPGATVFDLAAVLADYEPGGDYSSPEREALYASLPEAARADRTLAELGSDAMLACYVGEMTSDAEFLDEEWTELSVSVRVALETRNSYA